jgi:hypothetical protein
MRASAQRMASARLFAMPAVISVSTISSSGGLSRTITCLMSLPDWAVSSSLSCTCCWGWA